MVIKKNKDEKIYVKPLALASFKDQSAGTFLILKIKDYDDNSTTLIMPRKFLTNKNDLINVLIDHRYPIPSSTDHWNDVFTKLRQKVEARAVILKTPGFHESGYLLANNKFICVDDEQLYLEPGCELPLPVVENKGRLKDWENEVAIFALHSSRLMLSITTSFSAYIAQWAGIESGGFHFFGHSSMGKSTSLYFAESARGPRLGLGSWDMSEPGLRDYMAGHNDSLVTLDELKHLDDNAVKAAQKATKMIYKIASGQGKQLSTGYQAASQQKGICWRVVLLSTGELSLTEHAHEGNAKRMHGEEVRLIDVPADAGKGLGIFESLPDDINTPHELAKLIDERTNLYYGTAYIKFLDKLTKQLSKNKRKFVKKTRSKMNYFLKKHNVDFNEGFQVRFAERFALSYAAGSLAVEYGILPFQKKDVMQGISKCYRDAVKLIPISLEEKISMSRNDLETALNKYEFMDISMSNHGFSEKVLKEAECYVTSINGETYKAILPKLLKEIIPDDLVRKKLLKELANENKLLCMGNKCTRSPAVRISKSKLKLPRCYCFIQ